MENDKQQTPKNIRILPKGANIFLEGDLGEEMYIIKSGKVEVIREMGDSEIILASMGSSEFFGEMALFGDPRRSATVRASEKTEVFVITKAMLEAQFKKVPEWLVIMIKTIAQRIITTVKGVKARFPLGMDYSILKTILLLIEEHGKTHNQDHKAMVLNLTLARKELEDIIGLSIDDIDSWLKKYNFVNIIKVLSSKEELIIPDVERAEKYIEYLELKATGVLDKKSDIDRNQYTSFERIYKLLKR